MRIREVVVAGSIFLLSGISVYSQALYDMPAGVESRWSSAENPTGGKGTGAAENSRKKSPAFMLTAKSLHVLAEVSERSGTVRRIWIGFFAWKPKMLRGIRLDCYWDGAATPAVSAPIGDFFGVGLGQTAPFESVFFSSPEGHSFNALVPMPFRTGMKIVVTDETDEDAGPMYFDIDYTLGDKHGPEMLYFHAYFHRENPTEPQRDYEILPKLAGKGRFLGANIGVIANRAHYGNTWWGEGEVKMYIDGDTERPTINGSGTEDYAGAGPGFDTPYSHLYQGAPIVDEKNGHFAFYRYHVADPIYFRRDIRVTIQQIGIILPEDIPSIAHLPTPLRKAEPGMPEIEKAHVPALQLFEREDDWSSCAYFYLDQPENHLPQLIDVRERIRGL